MDKLLFLLVFISCIMLFLCIGCIIGDGIECWLKSRKKKSLFLKESKTSGTSPATSDFRAGYVTPPPLSLLTIERSLLAPASPERESGAVPPAIGATTLLTAEHPRLNGNLCAECMPSKHYATRRN